MVILYYYLLFSFLHSLKIPPRIAYLDSLLPSFSTDMKGVVLVVGSGGREHALTLALASSPGVTSVLVTPGNAGTLTTPKVTHITLPLQDHKVRRCIQQLQYESYCAYFTSSHLI